MQGDRFRLGGGYRQMPRECGPVLFALAALCFVARAVPRILAHRKTLVSSDTWFHLYLTKSLKENGGRVPGRLPGVLTDCRIDYQVLFHRLLSLFPVRRLTDIEPFVGSVIDTVYCLVVFAVAHVFLSDVFADPRTARNAAAVAAGLHIITPAMLGPGWGPRTLTATPRPLGQLLFFLTSICWVRYLRNGDTSLLALSVVFGSLLFMASKFSLQAFLFCSLFSCLFLLSWIPLLVFVASLTAATLVSRGYILKGLEGQVTHLAEYAASSWRGEYVGSNISERNRLSHIYLVFLYLLNDRTEAARILFSRNSFFYVALQIPAFPLFLYLCCTQTAVILAAPGPAFRAVELAMVVMFLLTSLRPLLFLGEAERYIEHALPYIAIHIALILFLVPDSLPAWSVYAFLVFSLGVYVCDTAMHVVLRRDHAGYGDGVIAWAKGAKIACADVIPRSTSLTFRLPFQAGVPVLSRGTLRTGFSSEQKLLAHVFSPRYVACHREIYDKYGVDHIVIDREHRRSNTGTAFLALYPVVYSDRHHIVLSYAPGAGIAGDPA